MRILVTMMFDTSHALLRGKIKCKYLCYMTLLLDRKLHVIPNCKKDTFEYV